MFRIRIFVPKVRSEHLLPLYNIPSLAEHAFPAIHLSLMNFVGDVFGAQGFPEPWAPLSLYTVWERLTLGFEEGPIMIRTGELLRSFIDPNHPQHVYRTVVQPHYAEMTFGSSDPRASVLSEGDWQNNLPARPILPDILEAELIILENLAAGVEWMSRGYE